MNKKTFLSLLAILVLAGLAAGSVRADVVKPALVEIQVNADGIISIEIRTSIEALLTGINGQFRNTQDAPQAERYDELRIMESDELRGVFNLFHQEFLKSVILEADGQQLSLNIRHVVIPEPGYTKVPRNSVIELETTVQKIPLNVRWYYPIQFSDQAVRLKQVNTERNEWHWSDYQWIREDKFSEPFLLEELQSKNSVLSIITTYLEAGFRHILPLGWDHILFVIGLLLLLQGLKLLVWQVTMFTIAHSITLGIATYGLFTLPSIWVEPLIALSIVFVGIENVFGKTVQSRRLVIVFCFGLLHGFGFATMLSEFGLPDNHFLLALLTFNLGVEIGQLTVLLIVWLTVFSWLKDPKLRRNLVVIPGSILISCVGAFWFLERVDLIN